MIHKVLIPQAFENMEEATLGRWLKKEGDTVREGDALCELITEKTTFDLPAENVPESAPVLRRIVASEKSVVPVGYCIAILGQADDELPEVEQQNAALMEKRQAASASQENLSVELPSVNIPPATAPAAGTRIRATPAARRAARERGVAIEDVAAAFPGKVLTEEDVAAFQA